MNSALEQLVQMSLKYGTDTNQIQAAGGNTSYKNEHFVWVKASGTPLSASSTEGFVQCHRHLLEANLVKTYSSDPELSFQQAKQDLLASVVDCKSPIQPSVETSLHVSLKHAYVAHTHPTLVNALTCSPRGKELVTELFGNQAIFVEYNYPGFALFRRVNEEITTFRKQYDQEPQIIFLKNHGIVVSGDTPEEIEQLFSAIFNKIRPLLAEAPDLEACAIPDLINDQIPAIRMLLSETDESNPVLIKSLSNKLSLYFANSVEHFERVSRPFCFDHVKYSGGAYLYVQPKSDFSDLIPQFKKSLEQFIAQENTAPRIILIKRLGLLVAGKTHAEAETLLELFEDQMKISFYSSNFGGPQFLSAEDIQLIENRLGYGEEVAPKRLDSRDALVCNRIAIVTGGAQGFGEGIVRELFSRGANLVIADLNESTSLGLIEELNHPAGENKAIFVKTDVSNAASVENLVRKTVESFGGLDLMVSNAGVLFAGGLDEMDPDTFDLVTRVNYKGFFLCAKYASAVMKIQAQHGANHFTDIIQINSKSGLKGSNKNFAYAGGKFGGIGLTQSFAMELIPYRIKVNAVCPGNLFDGPLWSDPEKGLFVQYLHAGKVPDAKTIADVKRFYESQVPANRGCTVADVMKAIYYIIDQEYETGQAVPVTGGQTMLH